MEEIKIGEYVRNADGYIEKMDSCDRLTNIYKDEDGKLRKWEGEDAFGNEYSSLIVKHSFNIIDLIEDEDFVILEYKSPKYRERIKRIFEVSKIDEYISFENVHCGFNCKVGDKKIIDNICKNVKIKSIVTHEQFQSVEYRLGE